MGWVAITPHEKLAPDTELGIFWQPWDPGGTPQRFPAGVDLTIDFAAGGGGAKVLEVTDGEATIHGQDNTRWRMEEVAVTELNYLTPAMIPRRAPATFWIVRERVE
jgi:hypothetical protein